MFPSGRRTGRTRKGKGDSGKRKRRRNKVIRREEKTKNKKKKEYNNYNTIILYINNIILQIFSYNTIRDIIIPTNSQNI